MSPRAALAPRKVLAPLLLLALALGGCHRADGSGGDAQRAPGARGFPRSDRPVELAGADSTQTEQQRDARGEAAWVLALAGVRPGMSVADIGAGGGYYTVRLSPAVGRHGRVLAEDIDAGALSRLGVRVERERLNNVSIQLGDVADPHLPPASFDRVLLVHVYRQVTEPYAFLWHLRGGLRAGGSVAVVEDDLPKNPRKGRGAEPAGDRFAIPPARLFCEFSALGFRLIQFVTKLGSTGYYAQFEAIGDRPQPADIKPCADNAGFSGGG